MGHMEYEQPLLEFAGLMVQAIAEYDDLDA
jgi:hypothetical protein